MAARARHDYPDEWLGYRVRRGATLSAGVVVELVGAEATQLQRWIGVRRIVDGDYRSYGAAHAGVPLAWLAPAVLRPLTPAADEFLAQFAAAAESDD
jgi:hypothetical protein